MVVVVREKKRTNINPLSCPTTYKGDPVLFCVPEKDIPRIKKEIEKDWHPVIDFTKDSVYSYQREKPIIPKVNGFFGRNHIRIYKENGMGIVTFHVDTPPPHKIDEEKTWRRIEEICESEIRNISQIFDLEAPNCDCSPPRHSL